MPLIRLDANGAHEIENAWQTLEPGAERPEGVAVILPLADFMASGPKIGADPIGVLLSPEDDPEVLKDHLYEIDLIAVSFPKYTDGRGYSQAQLLRRRLGWGGELRAIGHVLRDQAGLMARAGFDTLETTRANADEIVEALGRYLHVYQAAADGHRPVFALRHDRKTA